LHKAIADTFVEKLIERVKKIKVGDGHGRRRHMGPAVTGQYETDLRYIEIAKKKAKVLDRRAALTEGNSGKVICGADCIDNVKPENTLAQEEVFGPLLAVFRVGDFEEAMTIAIYVQFGLTCRFTRATRIS